MDEVLEICKILNYEVEFCAKEQLDPFTHTYFAIPAPNPGVQFKTFADTVLWLFKMSNNDFSLDKFDDPNTTVNKMMLALKTIGFQLDFPAGKLKQAHGEAVCSVLKFLAEKAMDERGIRWQRPVYSEEDYPEEADADDDADVGDEVEDELDAADDDDGEILYSEMRQVDDDEDDTLDKSSHGILDSKLDPVLWATELERVGPKLRTNVKNANQEWRGHIEQSKRHEATLTANMPQSMTQLETIGNTVRDALQRVSAKEASINSQFENLTEQYHQAQKRLKEVTEEYNTSSTGVSNLTSELSAVTEKLETVKNQVNNRGTSMTDSSILIQIKTALQSIRKEIQNFEVRIGVVGHTLMQSKLRVKNVNDVQGAKRRVQEEFDEDPEFDISDDDF